MWRTKFFMSSIIFVVFNFFQAIPIQAQGSWKIIRQIDTLIIYIDVDFVDKNNGWVVGYVPIGIPEQENEAGTIIHTSDGGETWEYQKFKTGKPIYAVDFVDSLNGWALAHYGIVLRTKDGGKNWDSDSSLCEEWWEATGGICFVDTLKGWVTGNNPQKIFFTEDGGKTWTLQFMQPERGLGSIYFVDSLCGWVAGIGGILHTTDGGENWELQYQCSCYLSDCYFINSSTGWVLGENGVLKTSNGGKNWIFHLLPGAHSDVSFADSLHGWIVSAYSNTILHTNDGGSSWIEQQTGLDDMASLLAACFIDSCTGWAIGYAGGELGLGTVLKHTSGFSSIENNSKLNDRTHPDTFELLQSFPNPFNLETTIRFYNNQAKQVNISIYDIQGRPVKNLLAEHLPGGFYEIQWNGRNQQGKAISSGVYLCVLEVENNFKVIKLVAIK